MVEHSEVTLLSPEIVLMEFDKQVSNSEEDFLHQTARISEHLKSKWSEIWNEVKDDLKGFLDEQLTQWRAAISTKWKEKGSEIRNWLTADRVVRLPFDQDLWFRAKRRLIEGRFPKSKDPKQNDQNKAKRREWEKDNDCSIIESLIAHFAGHVANKQLLFCTENLDDFGFEVKNTKSLDTRFQEGLPPTEIFTDLKSLVAALKARKTVELPTNEEVEQALKEKAAEEEARVAQEMSWLPSTEGTVVPNPDVEASAFIRDLNRHFREEFNRRFRRNR